MIVPLLCIGAACFFAAKREESAPRSGIRMRNMRFSHTNEYGERVFVPTARGKTLVSQGRVADVVCPTGETCSHACACSGVSATGVVGVGGSCRCITLERPPNPGSRGSLGLSSSSRSSSSRPVPPRPDSAFDRALSYAVGAGFTPEQCVAYVASRVAPGREGDIETMRRLADECAKRMASPGFARKCGCRG